MSREPDISVVYKTTDTDGGQSARVAIVVDGESFVSQKWLREDEAHDKAVAISLALKARLGGKTR